MKPETLEALFNARDSHSFLVLLDYIDLAPRNEAVASMFFEAVAAFANRIKGPEDFEVFMKGLAKLHAFDPHHELGIWSNRTLWNFFNASYWPYERPGPADVDEWVYRKPSWAALAQMLFSAGHLE